MESELRQDIENYITLSRYLSVEPKQPKIKKVFSIPKSLGKVMVYILAFLGIGMSVMVAAAEPVRIAFVNTITGNGGVRHTVSAKTDLSGLLLPEALSGYEISASRTGQSCYIEYTAEDGAQYAYSVKAGNAIDDIDSDYTDVESITLFGREAVLFTNDEQAAGVICMPSANFVATLVGGSSYDEIVQIAKTISIK